MTLDLILGSAILIALIAFYFDNNTATKVKNGVVLGVTLPYSEIKNNEVLRIVDEYKKGNKRFFLIGIIIFFPISIINYPSLKMIYLFVWIFFMEILSYKLFGKYNKRLKTLKRENEWFISQARLLTIDTEVTRLKDKMPVSPLWFIPSLIISIIPIIMVIINKDFSFGLLISASTGEVTRLKDKMPVSPLWFIPSLIISIIPIIMVIINKDFSFGLLISASTGLVGTITFMILYRLYCKKPTEIYSEDSKVNIAYNLIYKRMWTMGTVVAATVQSIGMIFVFLPMTLNSNSVVLLILSAVIPMTVILRMWTMGTVVAATVQSIGMIFVFLPMTLNSNSVVLLILSAVIPMTVILVGIYYINNKVTEEQNRLISTSNNPIYVDNDEYWFRDIYNNPNDTRYIVEPRVGYKMTYNLGNKKGRRIFYGSYIFAAIYWFRDIYNNPNDTRYIVEPRVGYKMTYNLGNKKGRRIFYGSYIFAAILIIGVSIMTLRLDFKKMSIEVLNQIVKIEAPSYSFDFNVDEIEEIKIIDSIKVNLRTNGAATDKYAIGYFNVEGYGNCRLYIYDKNNKFIRVKLKDGEYIFISGTSKEETNKYYKLLTENSK